MIGLMVMNNIHIILDYLDELYPDPKCELDYEQDYELLLAVVLSAQTTDKAVNKVTKVLFQKYPTLEALNNAEEADIALIIKPIGTYKNKAHYIKMIVNDLINNYGGRVVNDHNELTKLMGVGRKTANVVLANLYHGDYIAVDTHVARVSRRLSLTLYSDNVMIIETKLMKLVPKTSWSKCHHQLVLFGRYKCTARNPKCDNCKLKEICTYNSKQN